jgi:dihydroorotase
MDLMRDAGAAGLTDDGMPVANAGVLRKALRYQSLVGLTIALHEEDTSLSLGAPMNEGEVSARLGLRGQTGLAESTMIARDCAIAEAEGARIHVQHVSDSRSIDAIRLAKERGLAVTAEASPHHLLLTEGACSTLDTRTKMNPPLRFEHDRLALIAALADGTIDCVATDHAPHSLDEKEQPFEDAPFGVTGLETSFAALYQELVGEDKLQLGTLVERMTSGCIPFGIPEPRLRVGRNAEIAVFDPTCSWVAGQGGWASRSANSAFAGWRFGGRIVLTIAGGVKVHTLERSGDRS